MRRRAIAFEQAGRAKHQRPGADRGDVFRAGRLLAQESEHLVIVDHVVGAEPAGHADDIKLRAIGESRGRRQRQHAVACDRLDPFPDQVHLGAGHAGKDLHRPGEIELGHFWKYHKTNLQRFGHDDLRSFET